MTLDAATLPMPFSRFFSPLPCYADMPRLHMVFIVFAAYAAAAADAADAPLRHYFAAFARC